jgi:hypothetical protein
MAVTVGSMASLPRRSAPSALYLLTLLSAFPLGAMVAAAMPQSGPCSGIGFGCSLHGWDAAWFLLGLLGMPYAIALAAVLALLSALPERLRAIQTGVAVVGLAIPWAAALIGLRILAAAG